MAAIARRSFSGRSMSSLSCAKLPRTADSISETERMMRVIFAVRVRDDYSGFLSRPPQYRLLRGLDLVWPIDAESVRGPLQERRVLLDDLEEHVREGVQRLLALGLRRLHHQCLG